MKISMQECIVVDDEHAILLTEDDVQEFNNAASCMDMPDDQEFEEFMKHEVLEFLKNEIHLYYRGKMWGFNDTEVREEICEALKKREAS